MLLRGFLQPRLVLIEQRLQFRRQEFLEPGIDDIFPLQQLDGIAPLDLAEIGLVNKISQQPLQSLGQASSRCASGTARYWFSDWRSQPWQ